MAEIANEAATEETQEIIGVDGVVSTATWSQNDGGISQFRNQIVGVDVVGPEYDAFWQSNVFQHGLPCFLSIFQLFQWLIELT